ncbi:hypothetical protein Cfla_3415 [Cellulomonas flavigena DSM 20109]|uniref:Protein-glutamine gamma-glutamyltransferase-like C-terminal domain-containing protein n=1 Tax=Cellulomonas flavigena (strain ATCC 482 / DSM 20109 / BCRC 11376 / JCM 18109 / NBRC 3775 / NCIMB 8073 / NRS 134) TaxID=446466 RepID=D5UCQ7_CELFN|nr:DUF4129 domain-containing protein [Cellulomonas flavigena]ADG76292.1 hypothetical protein Cfla_3415 [Cellulomonas flavigena DSM 20109]
MPERRTSLATVLAALLVVVGVLAAALSGPLSLEARPYQPPMATEIPTVFPSAESPPPAFEDIEAPPPAEWAQWFVRVVQVLGALLVLTALVLLLRHARRGWRFDRPDDLDEDGDPGDDTGEQLSDTAVAALREGVQEATRALEDDVPPGDAVIGAWVAVETAAARTGVVRDRAETASEFAVRVLDATRADPAATRELLRLYLAARFGAHGVDAADVRRARDLLRVVGQGLVARADDEVAERPGAPGARPAGEGRTG